MSINPVNMSTGNRILFEQQAQKLTKDAEGLTQGLEVFYDSKGDFKLDGFTDTNKQSVIMRFDASGKPLSMRVVDKGDAVGSWFRSLFNGFCKEKVHTGKTAREKAALYIKNNVERVQSQFKYIGNSFVIGELDPYRVSVVKSASFTPAQSAAKTLNKVSDKLVALHKTLDKNFTYSQTNNKEWMKGKAGDIMRTLSDSLVDTDKSSGAKIDVKQQVKVLDKTIKQSRAKLETLKAGIDPLLIDDADRNDSKKISAAKDKIGELLDIFKNLTDTKLEHILSDPKHSNDIKDNDLHTYVSRASLDLVKEFELLDRLKQLVNEYPEALNLDSNAMLKKLKVLNTGITLASIRSLKSSTSTEENELGSVKSELKILYESCIAMHQVKIEIKAMNACIDASSLSQVIPGQEKSFVKHYTDAVVSLSKMIAKDSPSLSHISFSKEARDLLRELKDLKVAEKVTSKLLMYRAGHEFADDIHEVKAMCALLEQTQKSLSEATPGELAVEKTTLSAGIKQLLSKIRSSVSTTAISEAKKRLDIAFAEQETQLTGLIAEKDRLIAIAAKEEEKKTTKEATIDRLRDTIVQRGQDLEAMLGYSYQSKYATTNNILKATKEINSLDQALLSTKGTDADAIKIAKNDLVKTFRSLSIDETEIALFESALKQGNIKIPESFKTAVSDLDAKARKAIGLNKGELEIYKDELRKISRKDDFDSDPAGFQEQLAKEESMLNGLGALFGVKVDSDAVPVIDRSKNKLFNYILANPQLTLRDDAYFSDNPMTTADAKRDLNFSFLLGGVRQDVFEKCHTKMNTPEKKRKRIIKELNKLGRTDLTPGQIDFIRDKLRRSGKQPSDLLKKLHSEVRFKQVYKREQEARLKLESYSKQWSNFVAKLKKADEGKLRWNKKFTKISVSLPPTTSELMIDLINKIGTYNGGDKADIQRALVGIQSISDWESLIESQAGAEKRTQARDDLMKKIEVTQQTLVNNQAVKLYLEQNENIMGRVSKFERSKEDLTLIQGEMRGQQDKQQEVELKITACSQKMRLIADRKRTIVSALQSVAVATAATRVGV